VTPKSTKKSGLVAALPNAPATVASVDDQTSDQAFWKSVGIYFACVGTLFALLGAVLSIAPEAEPGVCDGIGISTFLGSDKRQGVIDLWRCATAYQKANEWFVLGMFELTYVSLKMFAIPAAFTLCVLSGAIFPLWQAQLLTGIGEAVGSSLCYLLSNAIARPIVARLIADKLKMLQQKAEEEREHMLAFNFFLRLTPLAPNWFINVASPIVGVPLAPFFFASLIGTQVTLTFQCGTGATLRTVGESGFDLGPEFKQKAVVLVLIMGLVQMIPIAWIRHNKRRKAERAAAKSC